MLKGKNRRKMNNVNQARVEATKATAQAEPTRFLAFCKTTIINAAEISSPRTIKKAIYPYFNLENDSGVPF